MVRCGCRCSNGRERMMRALPDLPDGRAALMANDRDQPAGVPGVGTRGWYWRLRRVRPRLRGVSFVALVLVVGVALLAGSSRAAGPAFAIVDLGTLGGGFGEASAVGPSGQVVGRSSTAAAVR